MLHVRKTATPVYDIFFSAEGYFRCDGGTFDHVSIQVDNLPPTDETCTLPKAGDTRVVFLDVPYSLSMALPGAKKIKAQFDFYGEGRREIEFDVHGFDPSKLKLSARKQPELRAFVRTEK